MKDRLIHARKARHDTDRWLAKQAGMSFPLLALLFVGASTLAAEPLPDAKEILATVRMQQSQQQIDLQGQLRQESTVVPFRLTQNGALVKYSFANPPEALQLRLGENDSKLEQLSGAGRRKNHACAIGSQSSRDADHIRRSGAEISLLARCPRRRGRIRTLAALLED